MTVPFEKWHGTGNDFLVVDAEACVPHRRAFAKAHCDRETGVSHPDTGRVGADGVLFLALERDCRPPRVVMTLVQPDGSTAPMCGNGARIAAAWAAERTNTDRIMLDTQAGTREATIDNRHVTIEMGYPSFEPAGVPLDRETPLLEAQLCDLTVTAVNTGVPHAVAFVPDVSAVDLNTVAPPIRNHDVFPKGANVTLASQRAGGFAQRTYERGVEGETRSCGTGAVAIGAVAHRLGLIDGAVTVSPPGGDLTVDVPMDGPATLRGAVECSFTGELSHPEPMRS